MAELSGSDARSLRDINTITTAILTTVF